MPNFPLDPAGYWRSPGYRGLKIGDQGWDVYALQTALNVFADPPIVTDGVFGERTHEAATRFQRNRGLLVDGVAGGATQLTLVRQLAPRATKKYDLIPNLLKGQIESESGNYLGNHAPYYSSSDSWDLGVAQINNKAKGMSFEECFDTPNAIDTLASSLRKAYDLYSKYDNAKRDRLAQRGLERPAGVRLWHLASGSWNRPAHTAYLAGESTAHATATLTQTQRDWIEAYMSRTTKYL